MLRPHRSLVSMALFLLVALNGGCNSILLPGKWATPRLTAPDYDILSQKISVRTGSLDLARANIAYTQAVEAMERGEANCVDLFFQAAHFSWCDLRESANDYSHEQQSSQIYRSSLNALIVQGQHHQRFEPSVGLKIRTSSGWVVIPSQFYGFSRMPEEFGSIFTVGDYSTSQLNVIYRQKGFGVPTVVQSQISRHKFQREQASFVPTVILRPVDDLTTPSSQSFALEFHNPLVASSVTMNGLNVPMAYDKSAAIARTLSTTKRNYVQDFLQPGNVAPDEEGLFMLEPYVEGKIPVVLVHGLLSDSLTWANLVNEIRGRPWFNDRFQIWGFEYATGKPFLSSAAMLRKQLTQLCRRVDPDNTDQALRHITLVGHSMGGLISKLLVSNSQDDLWNSIANRQFEEVSIDPPFRETLADSLFFDPVEAVERVIYIGTPHRGSAIANRAVGRLGSILIEQPEELKREHRKLMDENPNTFSEEFTRRIPTSLDLLEPDSRLLAAIERLQKAPNLRSHSILGSGRWMPGNGDSDGVVPVWSAQQDRVASERYVCEKHTDLPSAPETIDEVLAILHQHFASQPR